MFKKLVSNLPNKPSSITQFTAYADKLHRERKITLIIVLLAVILFIIQSVVVAVPAKHSLSASTNDILYGGGGTTKQDLLKMYQLNRDSLGRTDIQQIYNYYNVNDVNIASSTLENLDLRNGEYNIIGRVPRTQNGELPLDIDTSGSRLYLRPIDSHWQSYPLKPALKVVSEHSVNWILLESGNIVVKNTEKSPLSYSPTQCSNTDTPSCLTQHNTVRNVTQNFLANSTTTASAGDTIEYTLSIKNISDSITPNTTIQVNLEDILEYADILDASGATYTDLPVRTVTWETGDLTPSQEESRSMLIKVKTPIPTTAAATTDPYSYDTRIVNRYGNITEVILPQPTVKIIEQTITKLPILSSKTALLLSSLFVATTFFCYYRSRLYSIEVDLILAHVAKGNYK